MDFPETVFVTGILGEPKLVFGARGSQNCIKTSINPTRPFKNRGAVGVRTVF